jgi:hypothetical protein
MNLSVLFLIFVLTTQNHASGSLNPSPPQEQSDFSTEGEVIHIVPLSSSIRELLEQDSFVRETLKTESPPLRSLSEDWTLCSIVHLTNREERDYVVVGQHSLTGAHATHFWVYRETAGGTKLVLAAFADSLSIGKQRTNGLRNITTSYYTAVSDGKIRFTFDGNKYQSSRVPQFR